MAKATAHVFSGLPFAGKTTLAKQLEETEGAVRFSVDEWLYDILGRYPLSEEDMAVAERLKERFWSAAVSLLRSGQDVILDWNLWNIDQRQKWITRIEESGAQHKLYFLNVPSSILRERVLEEAQVAPQEEQKFLLQAFDRAVKRYKPPTVVEGYTLIEMYWQPDQPIHNPHLFGDAFFLDGGKVGVLLIHGLTATAAEVRLAAERLNEVGYTISAPLLPGHGTKPEDMNSVTWQDWVWEVEKAYHHLATLCDEVFVGGESTGGVLALELARKYPEIKAVLCYAPAIKLPLPLSNLVALYAAAPLVSAIPKSTMGTNEYWQGYRIYPLRGITELVALGRFVRAKLDEIKQPILIVQGRNDKTIAEESGDIILQGVASEIKERHWMEESAHVVLLEHELPQIMEISVAFIERVRHSAHK